MRLFMALLILPIVTACGVATGPDPTEPFSERNVGKTVITYVDRLGTQAVFLAPGGSLFLWSAAQEPVQNGDWKFDVLATGVNTTYQGAGGINHPVQDLETAWGICFRYRSADGRIIRRNEGGDWNCALLADYEQLIIDRAAGDIFQLRAGTPPGPMPAGARLTGAELEAL
ncbi:MAG: hypothetical protein AAGD13_11330 [Pseudomonadota bacterium]